MQADIDMNMLPVAPSPQKTNRECTLLKMGVGFFLITALTASVSLAGSVAAPYQIGTWEGFRKAAVSYTFDDDCPNQYAIAVPMFHTNGFKLTLCTVTDPEIAFGHDISWSQVQQAAAWGDEIASHTVTHVDLTVVSAVQLTNELSSSQSTINANVTNQECLTLAYPYCTLPNETITSQYYIAARICSGALVSSTPGDFMSISSFICGSQGTIQTSANFNNEANSATTASQWCVFLIHAIDNDNGYSPLSSTVLLASVNYMKANPAKFWVETFGNVVRYIKERNASSVAETSNTGNSITIQVTNSLNNSIYNYPITLRRPLPTGWPAAVVSQNNQPISAQLVTVSSTNFLMFDVVPNGGNVIMSTGIVVVAATQALGTVQDQAVSMPGVKLLAGSSDNMGYALAVTGVSSDSTQGGTVSWDGNLVTYTPPGGYSGQDAFSYTLSDGYGGSAPGTVVVTVAASGAQTLNMISLQLTPTNCQLEFAGVPGRNYIIQSAPAVTGPWSDVSGPVAADGTGLIQFIDTNAPGSMQFYRTSITGGNP
jgi:oligosaccharide reducing-end xylanase